MDANKEESFTISHRVAWVIAVVFLVLIGAPGIFRNVIELAKGREGWVPAVELFRVSAPTLEAHLSEFESQLETESASAAWSRRRMQGLMTRVFREGNRKTLIGREGWLYYRPELDSITGRSPWTGRIKVIQRFREQLEAMGVELILVPVPRKAVVQWEGAIREEVSRGVRWGAEMAGQLREIEAEGRQSFLMQDTHWSPDEMEAMVNRIADEIRGRTWFEGLAADDGRFGTEEIQVSAYGDLVDRLDLAKPERFFEREKVTVRRVIDRRTGRPVTLDDRESPIVLLGDSSVNIFGNEDLGFGSEAGFAQHLAQRLGMPLDVIAINGQGATGVRRALARRPGSARAMRSEKKAVVWVFALRDLYLPETVAEAEGVVWEDVEFDLREPTADDVMADPVVVEARLVVKSAIPDPRETTYKDALFASVYVVERVVEGEYENEEVLVYQWAFRERELHAATRFATGDRVRLRLVPLRENEEVKGIYPGDETGRVDLAPYWAEEVSELE